MSELLISEVMDKDPLLLTNDDLEVLIAYYREKRKIFNVEGPKPARAKNKEIAAAELKDLGL